MQKCSRELSHGVYRDVELDLRHDPVYTNIAIVVVPQTLWEGVLLSIPSSQLSCSNRQVKRVSFGRMLAGLGHSKPKQKHK